MKNPNSPMNRFKRWFIERWADEDYPGGTARFQFPLFARDIGCFILLPAFAVICFKACEGSSNTNSKRGNQKQVKQMSAISTDASKSQIIDFNRGSGKVGSGGSSRFSGISKRSPGTLVKVKLLNVVETYSTAPVHAQITDSALGKIMVGGTLIGDANPDPNFERINITFRFARDPNRENVAVPISARALSVDGTLGLEASKKEGLLARSAYTSATGATQEIQSRMNGAVDFKEILFRALTAGMVQEFGAGSQVERNRSQVLTLRPSTEFLAELTDFFPGGVK
jgi:hypothetical protein